jgi:tRNA threonylcarbamoyl adenosine modification protein YeaZ
MSALLLSLDTATDRPTFALGSSGEPGEDVLARDRRDLSRDIERMVQGLLQSRGVTPADLSGVVVADGPGSFTGLRIGIAFAKGLCRVLGIPLLAAPSLLGAARGAAAGDRLVVAEYDALRGDVYRAIYRFGAGAIEVVAAPALVGSGAPVPSGAARAGAAHASAAALLTLVALAGGPAPVEGAATWEPNYGRPAEAEARRLARHGQHR